MMESSERTDLVIVKVGMAELEECLPLIAEYQKFYRCFPNNDRNRAFFSTFASGENTLGEQYLCRDRSRSVGFATIYILPSSSIGGRYCAMNDLYCIPEVRGRGVGRSLISFCAKRARELGFSSLEWQTEKNNLSAQRLYDSTDALRTEWLTYSLPT